MAHIKEPGRVDPISFNGFNPAGPAFFERLAANNKKAWFEAHRGEYEKLLLEPLKALVCDMSGFMLSIDPDLVTVPAVDRTISRIYRDTRFSRDKSPYKTCLWITFKRQIKDWKDAPCFFFEITADSYRFGMGFYSASKDTMDRLRERMEQRPAEFAKAAACSEKQDIFALEGERYKRPLNPSLPDELQQWHQRKNLYLVCNRRIDNSIFSRGVLEEMVSGFGLIAPLYHYLWRVKLSAG